MRPIDSPAMPYSHHLIERCFLLTAQAGHPLRRRGTCHVVLLPYGIAAKGFQIS